eukprot:507024-Rhodomonas_salina.1
MKNFKGNIMIVGGGVGLSFQTVTWFLHGEEGCCNALAGLLHCLHPSPAPQKCQLQHADDGLLTDNRVE